VSKQNVEAVRRVFEAVQSSDMERVIELVDPEVEWVFSRATTWPGPQVYRGHDEVRGFVAEWVGGWDDYRFEVEELIDAGSRVVAVVRDEGRSKTAGIRVDRRHGEVWSVRDGMITRVELYDTRTEAIEAVGLMGEDRRDVGLLAVTSADRLNAGWTAAQRARERGLVHARSHIEKLLADVPSHCGIVSVIDGHPATLAWLGAVHGHRVRALGVEHFGQTGSIPELYRHYGIDANAIVAAAAALTPGRPIRHLKALP